VADNQFLHANPFVWDVTFLYCVALGHLLNNPTSETRAQDAFDLAYLLSQTDVANTKNEQDGGTRHKENNLIGLSGQLWLEDAQKLANNAFTSDKIPQDKPFLHDCRSEEKYCNIHDIISQ